MNTLQELKELNYKNEVNNLNEKELKMVKDFFACFNTFGVPRIKRLKLFISEYENKNNDWNHIICNKRNLLENLCFYDNRDTLPNELFKKLVDIFTNKNVGLGKSFDLYDLEFRDVFDGSYDQQRRNNYDYILSLKIKLRGN